MDTLHDPVLRVIADMVDDLESVRIANENRLRQLTRTEEDVDGEERGFGLTPDHPAVKAAQALVDGTRKLEHQAILELQRRIRAHPLGPWLKAQPGIGEKQGARLLAAIGDPYMRPDLVKVDGTVDPSRPRRVAELWAYCGYHLIDVPVDPSTGTAQSTSVGGEQYGGDPGQSAHDTHTVFAGVAAHRRRGARANWNAEARMRAYLVAAQCVKMPDGTRWRDVYSAARVKYADAVHRAPCPRCGPSGKPAPVGSALSLGHQHARAVRIVAKEILKELWRAAGRLHGHDVSPPPSGQGRRDAHPSTAAGG